MTSDSPSSPKLPVSRDDVRLSELSPSRPGGSLSRIQIVISLALALAIIGGAWLVGGRSGFGEIGSGGISRQYLPKAGETAPTLGMIGPNDQTAFLSQFKGHPVWINFWGSWCPPCQAEFPAIEAANQVLAPQGVVLLAISAKESWVTSNDFARANGGTFTVYNIPDLTIFGETWDVRNFPTHMYIDADGIVRHVSTKPSDTDALIARGEWLMTGDWTAVADRTTHNLRQAIRPEDIRA